VGELVGDRPRWTPGGVGESLGGHGGVWECPDLFPMTAADGKRTWVLIVNINPGGPQGGSATQYFTGDFDGKTFRPNNTATRWIDQGTDEYAGITWSNTGNRHIFLGWMSNWNYANTVPTKAWRSAMTIPRELKLVKVDSAYYVTSQPVKELNLIKGQPFVFTTNTGDIKGRQLGRKSDGQFELKLSIKQLKSFFFAFSADNTAHKDDAEKLIVGFDESENAWYIDRTKAGEAGFNKDFAKRFSVKRTINTVNSDITLILDATSVELFADNGSTVMTSIFFPKKPLEQIDMVVGNGFLAHKGIYTPLKSIWP